MRDKNLSSLQMDKALLTLKKNIVPRPHKGWIKAIREALSMSTRQMSSRLKCSQARIVQIEQNEIEETLSLHSLRAAAHALECDLVYYLIPRKPLDDIMHDQALKIAKKHLHSVAHSMKLEAQGVDAETEALQIELAADILLKKPSKLWNNKQNSLNHALFKYAGTMREDEADSMLAVIKKSKKSKTKVLK